MKLIQSDKHSERAVRGGEEIKISSWATRLLSSYHMAGGTSEQTYAKCFVHGKCADGHVAFIVIQIAYSGRNNSFKRREIHLSRLWSIFHMKSFQKLIKKISMKNEQKNSKVDLT